MALDSLNTRLRFFLNGKELDPPVEWSDISVFVNFDAEDQEGRPLAELAQANIALEEFTFPLSSFSEISQWIADGLSGGVGIFEAVPFRIEAFNSARTLSIFDGFLSLSDGLELLPEVGKYTASIVQDDGLENFQTRIEGLTFGFLEEEGIFTPSDYQTIAYIVKKEFDPLEAVFLSLTGYLLTKEFIEQLREVSRNVATIQSILASTPPIPPNPIGAAIFAAASAIFALAYAIAILNAIIDLARSLANTLVPPKREHKSLQLRTALSKVCSYLGLSFESTIADLDSFYYLPSNLNADQSDDFGFFRSPGQIESGIPSASDFGYRCSEMFQLCARVFNARFAILDGVVYFETEASSFWLSQADYTLPPVLVESQRYNTEELKANRLIRFETDVRDLYTTTEFRGTNYEIITTPNTVQNERAVQIKGLEEVRFPVALGARNNQISGIERSLRFVLQLVEDLAELFGSDLNLSGVFEGKFGALKVSENNHSIPKLLVLSGDRIPTNNRDRLSAKYLWENYHVSKSFVQNGYYGQKVLFSQEIPFGLEDFAKLAKNAYFRTAEGTPAKMVSVRWMLGKDTATAEYYVREAYTKNLQETFIEPE